MTEMQAQVPSSYPPPEEFAANANGTADLYKAAEADRLGFWAEQANRLAWQTPFSAVLDWSDAPFAKVVCRRRAQCRLQLCRPPRRGRQR